MRQEFKNRDRKIIYDSPQIILNEAERVALLLSSEEAQSKNGDLYEKVFETHPYYSEKLKEAHPLLITLESRNIEISGIEITFTANFGDRNGNIVLFKSHEKYNHPTILIKDFFNFTSGFKKSGLGTHFMCFVKIVAIKCECSLFVNSTLTSSQFYINEGFGKPIQSSEILSYVWCYDPLNIRS